MLTPPADPMAPRFVGVIVEGAQESVLLLKRSANLDCDKFVNARGVGFCSCFSRKAIGDIQYSVTKLPEFVERGHLDLVATDQLARSFFKIDFGQSGKIAFAHGTRS